MTKYWTKALINSAVIELKENGCEKTIDLTPIQEYCVNGKVLWCKGNIGIKTKKFKTLEPNKVFFGKEFETIILQAYTMKRPIYLEISEKGKIYKVKL